MISSRSSGNSPVPFITRAPVSSTADIMSSIISFFCRQEILDTQCGFRFISTSVLRAVDLSSSDYEIESEVLMKAAKKKFPIFSVPVKTIYSTERSKINPARDTIRFFRYIFRETWNSKH